MVRHCTGPSSARVAVVAGPNSVAAPHRRRDTRNMSVLLPAGLPAGFTIEPATGAHVAEVFALLEAEQTAAYGFCPDTPEDVRSELELAATAVSTEHLIRDAAGQVVQWWVALRDAGDPITQAWICPHPDLPDAVSDELARTGWALLLDWIRDTRWRAATASSRCTRVAPRAAPPTPGIWPRPGSPTSGPSGRCSARSPTRPGSHRRCPGWSSRRPRTWRRSTAC